MREGDQAFIHELGRDLATYNSTDRWILPVPATYLIDQEGIVHSAYVYTDFMKQLEPREILSQLKKL